MSMNICGKAGAIDTAQVLKGLKQGSPASFFGLFFDDLYSQLKSGCPSAGAECRVTRIPNLFYADKIALLAASAQGLQQLLGSMQSSCAANGLTISIPKTDILVCGGGHHDCAWQVAGQLLKRSQTFNYLDMLFHKERKIKHTVQARFSKACASVEST